MIVEMQSSWNDRWDFDADLLPLDFANTAEWHAAPEPSERLTSYSDLVGWSNQAGLLSQAEVVELLQAGHERADKAARTLSFALELREAIYQLFSAIAADQPVPQKALADLNLALPEALGHAQIQTRENKFTWGWSDEGPHLDRMLWPILHATAQLLTSDELDRVGECADDRGCGYLFYDTSRNHSRRWCSMESCGNRAKAQRHYQRQQAKQDENP